MSDSRIMSNVSVLSQTRPFHERRGDDFAGASTDRDDELRLLISSWPACVLVVAVHSGEIVHESPAAQALFGSFPESNSRRQAQRHFASASDYADLVEGLRVGASLTDVELELIRGDGTRFWASVSASTCEYRRVELAIFNIADISKYKCAEQRIARQSESLHQSEKLAALGTLLAGVAHELNNPLSVVYAQSLLMQDTARDPKVVERASKIERAADRCSRIVRTFLSMARRRPLERQATDINDIVESVMSVTGYSLRKNNIELKRDLASEIPRVWANDDELNQVVTNLIVNAQQAISEGRKFGNVRVVSAYDAIEHRVLLSISDDGPGISHELRSRIFEPFFTTKEIGEGTGIGLAVCHRIVESLHGSIRVSSHAGHGACFTISLPAISEERKIHSTQVDGRARVETSRVLIVDSEPEIASMLKEILTLDGHEVKWAASGRKALQLLARHDFQIILADLRMPGTDGVCLYDTLASLSPKLLDRVGFVTGDTFSSSTNDFIKETECSYIEKPFTPEQVRALVAELQSRTRLGALVK